jgi:hypothetical protein
MANRSSIMNKSDKIVGVAPRISHRAIELFRDSRFKPRVVRNKKIYNRKRRDSEPVDHGY